MAVKYGYTICDSASERIFREAISFIVDQLGYEKLNDELQDVDGSIKLSFQKGNSKIILESDVPINYVGIVADRELPIECLHVWTREDWWTQEARTE